MNSWIWYDDHEWKFLLIQSLFSFCFNTYFLPEDCHLKVALHGSKDFHLMVVKPYKVISDCQRQSLNYGILFSL